jgi:predicted Rdx family selenoprotein
MVAAPSFGIVDKTVAFKLRVDDGAAAPGTLARIDIMKDGKPLPPVQVAIGEDVPFNFDIDHGGQNIFEFSVERGTKELSLANNSAIALVNGVRDRLKVLLISGEPHAGERAWRSLLKSDPSVDLVHFTILRPPEKQDGTPINELSLIAFPVRELFELRLKDFDLVIFDRYRREGVLPRAYFDNIANYVEQGGALLDSAGPAFSTTYSLFRSPLGRVLPAEPTGDVLEQGFRPELTPLGRRHPVTSGLPGSAPVGREPTWGRWFRQIDAIPRQGVSVMSGIGDRPLLVLNKVGKGRTAEILSDEIWLWSRGYEGGGPQAELLRRVAHWLMKEPDLEEEDLRASVNEGRLDVLRRSLSDKPVPIEITLPSGKKAEVKLADQGDGRQIGSLPVTETGLYRLTDGTHLAFAASGALNPLEIADLRSTPEKMQPLVNASGGRIFRLAGGRLPEIRMVGPGASTGGSNWMGLIGGADYTVTGIRQMSLLPALAGLILGLGALMFAWRREGR